MLTVPSSSGSALPGQDECPGPGSEDLREDHGGGQQGLHELHQPGSALAPGQEGKGAEQNLPSTPLNTTEVPWRRHLPLPGS